MLPHNHFLIAVLAIFPAALAISPGNLLEWALVGGIFSAAIDLDVYALVLLKSGKEPKLRQFRNPINIYKNFRAFMGTVAGTGIPRIGMKTHLLVPALATVLAFPGAYFVPIALASASHLLSDVPNLHMVLK